MSLATMDAILDRIRDYLTAKNQRQFKIVLSGDEPAAWPLRSYEHFCRRLVDLRARGFHLKVCLQTKAARKLDVEILSLLAAHDVSIAVLLDDAAAPMDPFRSLPAGRQPQARAIQHVREMCAQGFGRLFEGFLTVANPAIPAAEYLAWIRSLPVGRVDVLWPVQYQYASPPWEAYGLSEGQYRLKPVIGAWLADLFSEWLLVDDPQIHIRYFYEVLQMLQGNATLGDSLVGASNHRFVINSDGGIEYPGHLRASREADCSTRFGITTNRLAELESDPVFHYLLDLETHLPPECFGCSFRHPCGGGWLPGRMLPGGRLPQYRSVLCHDQFHFFQRVFKVPRLHCHESTESPLFERAEAQPAPLVMCAA